MTAGRQLSQAPRVAAVFTAGDARSKVMAPGRVDIISASDPPPHRPRMSSLTVRNLPEATHRALKARAARQGRSTEAEVRAILEAAVRPRAGLGTRLAAIGRAVGGVELAIERDPRPIEPAAFK